MTLALMMLSAVPSPEAYAVVVATNQATQTDLPALKFADDDGARYFELLSLFAHTEILTVMDPDTQTVFPQVAGQARLPTRQGVLEAFERTFERMRARAQAGARTVFYFVYVGHGTVGDDGEAALHLVDGRFTRSDLFQHVIERSPADINHVIIDACNAYLMVARRGDGPTEEDIDAAVARFLDRESLDRHPNTGFVLATSQAAEVHEWSGFRAGVFSHEVRSGLVGGADVDGNGAVTYGELGAFVSAANLRVNDPRARIRPYISPPSVHLKAPLIEKNRVANVPTVSIPGSLSGRWFLEDARGVRYADVHPAPDSPITLLLVPSDFYFLRNDREERRLPLEVMQTIDAQSIEAEPLQLATRGSEAVTFKRDLFAIPFGKSYFEGFRASTPARPLLSVTKEQSSGLDLKDGVAIGLGAGGIGALAAALAFGLSANAKADDYRTAIGTPDQIAGLRQDSESAARTATILGSVGAGLVAGAVLTWLLPDAEDK